MSLQLLSRFTSLDTAQFDADAENRGNAGLTRLQTWTEADDGTTWVLFEVNDRAKAEDWLSKAGSLGHGPDAHHFLRTA